MTLRAALAGAALMFSAAVAHGAIDTYAFADEAQRQRYLALTQELRCPKCQNQDIADSNAPIAADLRREIVRLLGEGYSDRQVVDYMVDRYGEFIRYKPALTARTGVLWFGPVMLLFIGAGVITLIVRRRRASTAVALCADEQARLASLLDEHRP